MKRWIVLFAAILCVSACKKRYTYVEVIREQQIFGGTRVTTKEEVKIRARNDTAAYIEAYEKFCISQAVYIGMKERYGMPELQDVPLGFRLYNSKGKDISEINFTTKLEQEQSIEERAFRIGSEVFQR